jgi:manganese efflux pump family protein
VQAARRPQDQTPAVPAGQLTGRLLVTGAALSIGNLAAGCALGTFHVSLAVAAVIIGAVSITMSLAGLELGNRIGVKAGERGELLGGLVLIAVGTAVASGIL